MSAARWNRLPGRQPAVSLYAVREDKNMNDDLKRTVFYDRHVELNATMVDFGGWNMPVQYQGGILQEHLATRNQAGLFDVSHMGRFIISGSRALDFLQHVLSNNAAGLEVEESQYTMIPNENGGAVDDAYLYRFYEDEYLLVVNASNREKDWEHFQQALKSFDQVQLTDQTSEMAMLSLQGPQAKVIMEAIIETGRLPEPMRNQLSAATIKGVKVLIARTGYTGEPLCFELFIPRQDAVMLWDLLCEKGAVPIGLGARDTLRLEAGLPLYGHELGLDPENNEIPIFACPLARFAVSLSPLKADFIGKSALTRQFEAFEKIVKRDYSRIKDLPRIIVPVALTGKGVARAGSKVFANGQCVGFITSGTVVPHWEFAGEGIASRISPETGRRAITLALLDSNLMEGDTVEIEIRKKKVSGLIVPYFLRSEAPPFARAIDLATDTPEADTASSGQTAIDKVNTLITKAIANTRWRQQDCINLIPSEQSPSAITRMLTIMDPVCRYGEHKEVKAFEEAEVFYYQGTDFIAEVEELLVAELRQFLSCSVVETRPISGQMANTAVFSAMVDYINRADRKSEQRRINRVFNNHIIRGGHLSAQPMGALRDFVARDPKTEKPAVINFPVREENPYQIDVAACGKLIEQYRPELVIFGKSMVLHKEPVKEIRTVIDQLGLDSVVLYDMAHVLGLIGPHFQEPFQEGAHLVTGSTHKTYFGPQRGIVAGNYQKSDPDYGLWEAIERRAFPGSTSNHHLGTQLGLLMAAYEMNAFKDEYQQKVIANAKAFALALKECGLDVAGDPAIDYTETHQVIVNVGYAKGAEIARRLEDNNIVLNYQAAPDEEGFTASGALRMGVSEMTRFGMAAGDFQQLAQLMADVIINQKSVQQDVAQFRKPFCRLRYCFDHDQIGNYLQEIQGLLLP
jgi:aminomethyltransferase